MLAHHGVEIGRRHARKHLGWALDTAAATAGAPLHLLKTHRSRVLTAEEPALVQRRLADAFDAFGGSRGMEERRMSAVEPLPTTSAADAVLNALPHPVIVVASDGKIVDANVAAE